MWSQHVEMDLSSTPVYTADSLTFSNPGRLSSSRTSETLKTSSTLTETLR